MVSQFEFELVRAEIPGADVRLISNIHQVPGRTRGFWGRKDLFFIGGFEHPPNVDGVKWLAEDILPLVRQVMENCYELSVPLKVDITQGTSWKH